MDRPPRANPPRFPTNSPSSQQQRPPLPPKKEAVTFTEQHRPSRSWDQASPAAGFSPADESSTKHGGSYTTYKTLAYQNPGDSPDLESPSAAAGGGGFNPADVRRKKSLVRPDRERIDPNHRQWHYREHAKENEDAGRLGLMPSTTGNVPQGASLRRGRSLLARDDEVQDSGLFKRGTTLRRKRPTEDSTAAPGAARRCFGSIPGPHDAWVFYCYLLTACIPGPLLSMFGIRSPEQQRAWREKMGLLAIILSLMGAVGFITFGFTQTVCKAPPARTQSGFVQKNFLIAHGIAYDLGKWNHPAVSGVFTGTDNPLFDTTYNAGGSDASFMFQNVNQHCGGIITLATGSSITVDSKGNLGWYFPCNLHDQYGQSGPNLSGYDSSKNCHIKAPARNAFNSLTQSAQVYFTWNDVRNSNRNLVVYESRVLDLSLLNWLDKSQVKYPPLFDQLKVKNGTFNGKDLSMYFLRSNQKALGACLQDITTVGFIDTNSIGCVASEVVLYVMLVFIIGVVSIKFFMAVLFGWFLSWKIGSFTNETYHQRAERAREIENWTDNIHSSAPARFRPTVKTEGGKAGFYGADKRKTQFFPTTSRFSRIDNLTPGGKPTRPTTAYGSPDPAYRRYGANSPIGYGSKTFLGTDNAGSRSSTSLNSSDPQLASACPWPLAKGVIPQPSADYEPHNYPLAHTICLVTAYSESIEGLRTTLDSLATTDYPNSHKIIMVIADGMVKGSGNSLTTPEIVLTMMKDLIIPADEVLPHSYVAIADGHKRHNMAKVYAGFYDYSDATVETSKQQRVPIVLVAKVGNPLEANEAKPGNRGKRDSQIVLMAFLQKVMFDERMTTFEYEFFNSIWRVTGISPDRYEIVLCVDADTKVFPDSISRMVACMVHDEEIMGLCGETKIANKAETWVTMIQVFEYYISHHLTKAFESMFGGVTCLPGCFSMYRIKAPKGREGFWVPVLANPDIVEHYSENIVDTLHKKNLLLLGEDRYLTTLMLKTFPKRKMIFCPQAVCKTIVPDTFSVLLSQRRRWINSTVHNLAELLLVRDLCGTFCFSMQFVVFMELAGTLVLPAAISFTIYLIIYAAIPSNPTPTIPLILLGVILGLPGLLIVVTSRKVEYLGWMIIYLFSLPIWNFVLPAYSFWHFDDFSWGQTRMVAGEKAVTNHGDKEGEFDSSHIVMKRWAEFERDRRFKSGTHSRDSTHYDVVQRTDSPRRDSKRFSVVSTSEMSDAFLARQPLPYSNSPMSYGDDAGSNYHRQQRGELMLPAPLSVAMTQRGMLGRDGSPVSSRSHHGNDEPSGGVVDSTSHLRLIPSPGDYYSNSPEEQEVVSYPAPVSDRYSREAPSSNDRYSMPSGVSMPGGGVRHGAVSVASYPGETPNPYRNSTPQVAAGLFADDDAQSAVSSGPAVAPSRSARGGVSLVDRGPVTSEVRRVPRPSARKSSVKVAPQSTQQQGPTVYSNAQSYGEVPRSSRSSTARPIPGPPAGAASPMPPQGTRWDDPRYQ